MRISTCLVYGICQPPCNHFTYTDSTLKLHVEFDYHDYPFPTVWQGGNRNLQKLSNTSKVTRLTSRGARTWNHGLSAGLVLLGDAAAAWRSVLGVMGKHTCTHPSVLGDVGPAVLRA